MQYLAIDCFPAGRPTDEPTWESHVRVVCQKQGWDLDSILQNDKTLSTKPAPPTRGEQPAK